MERMLLNGILTDVKIKTSDKGEIDCHKCVLARSPVFLAMFQNDMTEKMQNEVAVHNIRYQVMKEMVYYIYTDKINKLDPIAGELFVAADFYDLKELKELCLKSLEVNVTYDNFAQSLYIAETYAIKSLKESVLRFIIG
jgi:speckle-type POZ protein